MSKLLTLSQMSTQLNKLKNLGHERETFTARGIEFELRTITRQELRLANEAAVPLLEAAQEAADTHSLSDWVQAVKVGALSFALMRVDTMDFNGVTTILDDSNAENPERMQKHMFVRALLSEWEESIVEVLYLKFQELTERAEDNSKDGVVFLKKSPEEELEQLEQEVAKKRALLDLPPLVPLDQQKLPDRELEVPEEPLNPKDLKDRLYNPEKAPERTPNVQHRDLPQPREEVPPQAPQAPVEPPFEEVEDLKYMEDGNGWTYEYDPNDPKRHRDHFGDYELSEQERLYLEQERYYQERIERQQAREARQALNQTNVQFLEGDLNRQDDGTMRSANARTSSIEGHPVVSNPNGVEVLGRESVLQQNQPHPQAAFNTKPKGKGNPNFYSPNRRK